MLYVKTLHIIFVVTWFAALFYLPRLLVYAREAQDDVEEERETKTSLLLLMQKRLLRAIMWPSAILTGIFGIWLWTYYPVTPNWLWLKLLFVICLYGYHWALHRLCQAQQNGNFRWSSDQLRLFNELPTVLLFAIVGLVTTKSMQGLAFALMVLVVMIVAGFMVYRVVRRKQVN